MRRMELYPAKIVYLVTLNLQKSSQGKEECKGKGNECDRKDPQGKMPPLEGLFVFSERLNFKDNFLFEIYQGRDNEEEKELVSLIRSNYYEEPNVRVKITPSSLGEETSPWHDFSAKVLVNHLQGYDIVSVIYILECKDSWKCEEKQLTKDLVRASLEDRVRISPETQNLKDEGISLEQHAASIVKKILLNKAEPDANNADVYPILFMRMKGWEKNSKDVGNCNPLEEFQPEDARHIYGAIEGDWNYEWIPLEDAHRMIKERNVSAIRRSLAYFELDRAVIFFFKEPEDYIEPVTGYKIAELLSSTKRDYNVEIDEGESAESRTRTQKEMKSLAPFIDYVVLLKYLRADLSLLTKYMEDLSETLKQAQSLDKRPVSLDQSATSKDQSALLRHLSKSHLEQARELRFHELFLTENFGLIKRTFILGQEHMGILERKELIDKKQTMIKDSIQIGYNQILEKRTFYLNVLVGVFAPVGLCLEIVKILTDLGFSMELSLGAGVLVGIAAAYFFFKLAKVHVIRRLRHRLAKFTSRKKRPQSSATIKIRP